MVAYKPFSLTRNNKTSMGILKNFFSTSYNQSYFKNVHKKLCSIPIIADILSCTSFSVVFLHPKKLPMPLFNFLYFFYRLWTCCIIFYLTLNVLCTLKTQNCSKTNIILILGLIRNKTDDYSSIILLEILIHLILLNF